MLRRPPRRRSIWIVPNPVFAEAPSVAGDRKRVPRHRSGRWKPLGANNHVPSDPTLFKLGSFLGKDALMDYVRRAANSDSDLGRLVNLWDHLSSAAKRAVSLTDVCVGAGVSRARFVSAAARGSCLEGHSCVLLALQQMELPEDIEAAVREFYV